MELYCPAGHGPFPDWADVCPECDRTLLGREPIVYLATAPNEPIAQMWLEALRDQGISASAQALGPGIGGWFSTATLEHDISVLAPDLERSREIIAEWGAPQPQ